MINTIQIDAGAKTILTGNDSKLRAFKPHNRKRLKSEPLGVNFKAKGYSSGFYSANAIASKSSQ